MFELNISRYCINADKWSIYDKTEFEEIGVASVDKKKRDFICERKFCSLLKIWIESVVGRLWVAHSVRIYISRYSVAAMLIRKKKRDFICAERKFCSVLKILIESVVAFLTCAFGLHIYFLIFSGSYVGTTEYLEI
jgi:hypothetical protein